MLDKSISLRRRIRLKLYENDRIRFVYHKTVKRFLNKNRIRNSEKDIQEISSSISEMKTYGKQKGKRLLVSGHIGLSPRTPFLIKLNRFLPNDYEIVHLVENVTNGQSIKVKRWKGVTQKEYTAFRQFLVPTLFLKDTFIPYEKVCISLQEQALAAEKPYLAEAVENLKQRHFNMDGTFAVYFAVQSYLYLNQVIDTLSPDCVMLWNQFFAFHHILEGICRERNIKCMYFEFGVLPGTYAVETLGQMGESYPAQEYKKFRQLYVSENEIKEAGKISAYIKAHRLNRKAQPKKDVHKILDRKRISGRPVIFYAGQNDFESGLCPYTMRTEKYHSPIFRSSDEAAYYLAGLARKNGWHLIYKMHPLVSQFCPVKRFPSNVTVLNNADIHDLIAGSDLTVTILSQTGYAALCNEKPVLMMGYTQLRGKGCTYEAFCKDQIERKIKKALRNGYTERQKENFKKHMAQIVKYYVFQDEWFEKKLSYGRSIKECAELIKRYMEA